MCFGDQSYYQREKYGRLFSWTSPLDLENNLHFNSPCSQTSLSVEDLALAHHLLVSRNQAVSRGELSVRTSKRLSTSTNRNKVLAILESLTLDQVCKEIHQIAIEAADVAAVGGEGVNLIDTVVAIPQLPRVAGDGDSGDGRAGGGDWAGAAECGQPDHDFVFVFAACGRGGEDVVRDVGDDVAAGLNPLPAGGEGLDLADLDGVGLGDDVGVGLDLA